MTRCLGIGKTWVQNKNSGLELEVCMLHTYVHFLMLFFGNTLQYRKLHMFQHTQAVNEKN